MSDNSLTIHVRIADLAANDGDVRKTLIEAGWTPPRDGGANELLALSYSLSQARGYNVESEAIIRDVQRRLAAAPQPSASSAPEAGDGDEIAGVRDDGRPGYRDGTPLGNLLVIADACAHSDDAWDEECRRLALATFDHFARNLTSPPRTKEAVVERVGKSLFEFKYRSWKLATDTDRAYYRDMARAALEAAGLAGGQAVAWVPVHPTNGPLWSMTTADPDPERLPSYPLKALCFTDAHPESPATIQMAGVVAREQAVIATLPDDLAFDAATASPRPAGVGCPWPDMELACDHCIALNGGVCIERITHAAQPSSPAHPESAAGLASGEKAQQRVPDSVFTSGPAPSDVLPIGRSDDPFYRQIIDEAYNPTAHPESAEAVAWQFRMRRKGGEWWPAGWKECDRAFYEAYQDDQLVHFEMEFRALCTAPRPARQETVAPEPYRVGNTYRTLGGELVTLVGVANEGERHETMFCSDGVHRYTRRDFGRVTGTDHAYTDPRNIPPLYTAPHPSPAAPEGEARDVEHKLRAFAQGILPDSADEWGDVELFDIHNAAVKHGLLREVTMSEPCGDRCQCAVVDGDFPLTCYRFTSVYTGRPDCGAANAAAIAAVGDTP